jgi:hypothetical protein
LFLGPLSKLHSWTHSPILLSSFSPKLPVRLIRYFHFRYWIVTILWGTISGMVIPFCYLFWCSYCRLLKIEKFPALSPLFVFLRLLITGALNATYYWGFLVPSIITTGVTIHYWGLYSYPLKLSLEYSVFKLHSLTNDEQIIFVHHFPHSYSKLLKFKSAWITYSYYFYYFPIPILSNSYSYYLQYLF